MLLLFFFNDTATTEIYTLSLPDALPISRARVRHAQGVGRRRPHREGKGARAAPRKPRRPPGLGVRGRLRGRDVAHAAAAQARGLRGRYGRDARSEEHRLNSSHGYISYAVFCLKKKKTH